MASPTAGTYRIVSAKGVSSSPFSLDVSGGSKKNGANVQIYTPNYTAAQFFRVSYRRDGSGQILSLWSGKSLDITSGNVASGTNIQQWTDNDTRAQQWVIASDGDSATYDGTEYPTYTIKSKANTNLAFDIAGGSMANGTNVRVYTANGTEAQQWLFVPMPAFSSGGTYELRSMLKTSMAVDISGGSDVKGANVQLYHTNSTNAQVFYITEESAGEWSIKSVKSNMYVDVQGGTARNGQNVQQWTDNDTRAQRWVITPYGTTTINGVECQVVTIGSMVSGGSTYMMDVENALTTDKANIQIATASGATSQRFALYPAAPKNDSLPVPAQVGWAESVGDADWTRRRPEATAYYPTWVTTESWASDSANHYDWRYRSRLMGGSSSTWGSFGAWVGWETASVTISGKQSWVTEGLSASVPSGSKAMQYEVQVRSVEPNDDGTVSTGLEAAATLQAELVPTITLSTAGFGPEGLRISYASDYDMGTNNISVDSIVVSGNEMLSEGAYFSGLDESGSILIEMGNLTDWIDDGATATVTYRVGTDQWATFDDELTATLTVSYNTGSGLSATPTITVGDGKTIEVTVPTASIVSAWMRQGNGSLTQMRLKNGKAILSPPFGGTLDYEFYVALQSGDNWGVAHITSSECSQVISNAGGFRSCHAWNWDGGWFVLEVREGDMLETSYSVSRNADTFLLNNRKWESVHYSPTSSGSFKAEGSLPSGFSPEDARERLFAMCEAGYVTYRSPHGLVADVAVMEFDFEQNSVYAEVSVDMKRVSN